MHFKYTRRRAYREFEERAERQRPQRGSKTELVEYALENMLSSFGIADVEQHCPHVSRDTIRLVMNRWREQGRWKCWEGAETPNGGEKGENRNTILMWE
jgi:transposase-like protein